MDILSRFVDVKCREPIPGPNFYSDVNRSFASLGEAFSFLSQEMIVPPLFPEGLQIDHTLVLFNRNYLKRLLKKTDFKLSKNQKECFVVENSLNPYIVKHRKGKSVLYKRLINAQILLKLLLEAVLQLNEKHREMLLSFMEDDASVYKPVNDINDGGMSNLSTT